MCAAQKNAKAAKTKSGKKKTAGKTLKSSKSSKAARARKTKTKPKTRPKPSGQYAVDLFVPDGEDNRIDEVVVFTDQAYINRRAKARVWKGLNRLRLELKAFYVDGDSVQAGVMGNGEVLSVQYKEMPVMESPQKAISDLQRKLRSLRRKKRELEDGQGTLALQKQFVNSLIDFARIQVPRDVKTSFPTPQKLQKTLDFVKDSCEGIAGENRSIDFKIEDIDREIDLVERQLETIAGEVADDRKLVEVIFRAEKTHDITINTSYVVYQASWEPVYKVDVPLELTGVQLTMFSMIRQQTGEDWNGVTLSVSNVVPLKGMKLPVPYSWHLRMPRPARKRGSVVMKSMAAPPPEAVGLGECELPAGDMLMDAEPLESRKEASFAAAEQRELPNAFEYQLQQQLTIPSSDQETILPLFTRPLEGAFRYHLVPRVQPLAFLVCHARADKVMMAGALNVYLGGRFVGCTYLDEKQPDDDIRLNLGAERNLRVSREKLRDKLKETFLGKFERQTISRQMTFKTVVENLKDCPVNIELFDSVPVSTTDKIEVKLIEIKPKPSEQDYREREGVVYWNALMEPGETAEFRIGFNVSYPKDAPPLGL